MKLCRYDDDRLGVVRGDRVHDVTAAQTEIRQSSPYAMLGDAEASIEDGVLTFRIDLRPSDGSAAG